LREKRGLRVSENRMLRKIFWPKKDEVTGDIRQLRIEKLTDLYSISNIFWVTKLRRMRWAGHVAWGEERRVQGFGRET
jgi:hypothetical protein